MMRSDSGRGSSSSEPEGAEVVYSKENVTIHPTQFASERISGRLRLTKQGSGLFIVSTTDYNFLFISKKKCVFCFHVFLDMCHFVPCVLLTRNLFCCV